MKATKLIKVGDFQTIETKKPEVKGTELLVEIGACGICGSDIPRTYETGASGSMPMTLGHEFSGTIVEVGEKADPSLVGKRGVFFPLIPCMSCDACQVGHYAECSNYNYMGSRCDGGFAEYCKVPSVWNFVESKNEETSMETLAMTEPACVAQHAIRQSQLLAGQSIVIFGAGPIGNMVARWAKIFGAETIVLVDIDDTKVNFAKRSSMHVVNSMKEDVLEFIKKHNKGDLADVVIEGTGSGAAFNNCVECIKPFGTIVLMGNPGGDVVIRKNNYSSLLRKEVTIKSVWNSFYANIPLNEWRYTVDMMDSGKFKVEDLITHRSNLDNLPTLFEDIYKQRVNICKAMYVAD